MKSRFCDAFDDMGFTIHTFSYTRTWLKYLKQRGYKLYYLSNFSKPLFETVHAGDGIFKSDGWRLYVMGSADDKNRTHSFIRNC